MNYKHKNIKVKITFILSVLTLILSISIIFQAYYYIDNSIHRNIFLSIKSLFPDETIKIGSLELVLEQPFLLGKKNSSKNWQSFTTMNEVGRVEFAVITTEANIAWEELAFDRLRESKYKDICATLYEYNTLEGPVYVIFSLYRYNPEYGFTIHAGVIIPHRNLEIDIRNSKRDVAYILEYAKPYISNDPNIKLELANIYYGGQQEW